MFATQPIGGAFNLTGAADLKSWHICFFPLFHIYPAVSTPSLKRGGDRRIGRQAGRSADVIGYFGRIGRSKINYMSDSLLFGLDPAFLQATMMLYGIVTKRVKGRRII